MNVSELLRLAQENSGLESNRKLAAVLGVTHAVPTQWRTGLTIPKPEHAAHLAELAGLDPVQVVAEVLQESAKDARLRGVYARIKTAVMAAAVCILCKIHAVPPTAPLTAPPQPSRGSTWRLRHPITGKTGTSKGNFFAHRTVTGSHRNASSPAYS